jgi:hypothetical protein
MSKLTCPVCGFTETDEETMLECDMEDEDGNMRGYYLECPKCGEDLGILG